MIKTLWTVLTWAIGGYLSMLAMGFFLMALSVLLATFPFYSIIGIVTGLMLWKSL